MVPFVNCKSMDESRFQVNNSSSTVHVETYPLLRIENVLASLGKGRLFSKFDLAGAYLQLVSLRKGVREVRYYKGLYHFNRLASVLPSLANYREPITRTSTSDDTLLL